MTKMKWQDLHVYYEQVDSPRRYKAIYKDRTVRYFPEESVVPGVLYSYTAEVIIDLYTMKYYKHRTADRSSPVSLEHLKA